MLDGLKRFLGFKSREDELKVIGRPDGAFYIVYDDDGEVYAGPYNRASDAKGQLTRLRKSYTPAARRPRA